MEIKVEKPKSYIRKVEISLPYVRFEDEMQSIAKSYKSSVSIPGFRKGKAPISIILNKFREEIENEARGRLIKDSLLKVLREKSIDPITSAEISDFKVKKDRSTVTFTAKFQVVPNFEVNLKNLKLTYKVPKVGRKDINKEIENLQNKYTMVRSTEEPSKSGDSVEIDYKVFNEEGSEIDVVQGMVIECQNDSNKDSIYTLIKGVKSGDSVEGQVVYPEEFPRSDLHNKKVNIKVDVREVKEKHVPTVNDDFAKTVGMDSVKELKKSIKEQLHSEKRESAFKKAKQDLIDKLLEKNAFEVPDALLNFYMERFKKNLEAEGSTNYDENNLRKIAKKMSRLDLIIDKIAEIEKIEATDEEIDEVIEKSSKGESMNREELKTYLEQTGKINDVVIMLRRDKVYKFLHERFIVER
jgi:trigger factor